ncbi:MAG TPA: PAS domain-containing protein [Rhizomicrobium sp.]|nr:PAS domain-containing protein [Rhizomicrobium sp.]
MNGVAGGNFEEFLLRIESPALRAVAQHWHEARRTRRMPALADLPPPALAPYAKFLWSFAYDPKTGQFTGRLAGDRWSKWAGKDFHGRPLKDFHSASSYRESRELLTRIVTTPQAFRSSGRLFAVDDFAVTGERIVLPLATDGKTGDGVLGASHYVSPPLLGQLEMIHENIEWYAI